MNTTYTNSTGRPIQVMIISAYYGGTTATSVSLNGTHYFEYDRRSYGASMVNLIIPNWNTYGYSHNIDIGKWLELR